MRIRTIFIVLITIGFTSCSVEKLYTMKQQNKVHSYEQIDFHNIVKRYMNKEQSGTRDMEGIYSVSLVVYKKGKGVLSSVEKEKIWERKENYMQVAILKDSDKSNREYIEIPLDKKYLPSYSVRGEFSRMAESSILIYNHFESKGRTTAYTFTYDRTKEMLEGVRKENSGQFEYTWQLTYIKLQQSLVESTRK